MIEDNEPYRKLLASRRREERIATVICVLVVIAFAVFCVALALDIYKHP